MGISCKSVSIVSLPHPVQSLTVSVCNASFCLVLRAFQGKILFSSFTFLISGAAVLPCLFCESEKHELGSWREVTSDPTLLDNTQTKIRQHLSRAHGLKAGEGEGQEMIQLCKTLLCSLLHETNARPVSDI